MTYDNGMPSNQAVETQTLFDDVDKKVLLLQIMQDRGLEIGQEQLAYMREAILTLARAVQTLRPSTLPTPIECSQEPDLSLPSKQSLERSGGQFRVLLSIEESDLILHMRKEGLSPDKLTSVLSSADQHPFLQGLARYLLEET